MVHVKDIIYGIIIVLIGAIFLLMCHIMDAHADDSTQKVTISVEIVDMAVVDLPAVNLPPLPPK